MERKLAMKIVVLDGYTLCPGDLNFDSLRPLGEVAVYDRTAGEDVAERIGDAQIVLTNKTVISREIMEKCPAMRYIGVLATGYNVVDIAAASECGVVVTNVPAYSTQAVAQHTFALLLASVSRVHEYDAQVKQGRWQASPDFCFYAGAMEELSGKVLGIIGFGNIGQAVARIALAFGMRVLVHTRTRRAGWEAVQFVTKEELFERSDVITLHCPLTEKTQGIIDANAIAQMKDGVRVINTSRGPLVNERNMAEALNAGKVSRYMADVLSAEPAKEENPLLSAPNTLLTPHVAWAPLQTRERLLGIAVENIRDFMKGSPHNVVNGN